MESLYELFWLVGVNDFILKFAAVVAKIFVVLTPVSVLPCKRRGKYFLFVERSSQLHRELAPIQVSYSFVCLFVCIDRFKSRVTTFHINCWDANVFFRVWIS